MSAEVEARAREMGWVPKDEFKLDAKRWVDADTYIARGEDVLPILRANNRKLSDDVVALRGDNQKLAAQLAETQAAIEDLKNFNSEISKTNAKARKTEMLSAIAKAKTDGDVETEVQLTDQLSELNAELKESAKKLETKPTTTSTKPPPPVTAEMTQWMKDNPWFGTDKRKTGYAFGIAEELVAEGLTSGTVPFLKRMDVEINKQFNQNSRRQAPSKVESSNNGSSDSSDGAETYADLPQVAKEACEKLAPRFVGKSFKDISAWRAHYVAKYFEPAKEE